MCRVYRRDVIRDMGDQTDPQPALYKRRGGSRLAGVIVSRNRMLKKTNITPGTCMEPILRSNQHGLRIEVRFG